MAIKVFDLPTEIWIKEILPNLSGQEIASFSAVSKLARSFGTDRNLWFTLCMKKNFTKDKLQKAGVDYRLLAIDNLRRVITKSPYEIRVVESIARSDPRSMFN